MVEWRSPKPLIQVRILVGPFDKEYNTCMAHFESPSPSSRLEDSNFVKKIRDQFADEWEELVTGKGSFNEQAMSYVGKIRVGEKVPKSNIWLNDKLVRIGQDFRLSPDEIDKLQEIFLA